MPEVRAILAQVFKISSDEAAGDPSPDSVPAWDSMSHLQLIFALEATFGIRFHIREMQAMDSAT